MIKSGSSAELLRTRLADVSRTHGRLLFSVAFRILRDRQAAEDACQQAFAAACAQPAGRIDARRVVAWLTRVVINECFQQQRRQRVEVRGRDKIASQQEDCAPSEVEPWLRDHVWARLDELPEPTRTVIVLRVMQGVSGNEVKDLLGVSAALVSRHLHRGIDALRAGLSEYAQLRK